MGERLAGKIAIVRRGGGLDILHNNVGIESRQTLMDTTEHEWDRVMAVSLKSMLLATQAAVPALERRGQTLVVDGGLTLTTR